MESTTYLEHISEAVLLNHIVGIRESANIADIGEAAAIIGLVLFIASLVELSPRSCLGCTSLPLTPR
jgi:hypothetical protein